MDKEKAIDWVAERIQGTCDNIHKYVEILKDDFDIEIDASNAGRT